MPLKQVFVTDNGIFQVSPHQALWAIAKYALTSKMPHTKISRRVYSK